MHAQVCKGSPAGCGWGARGSSFPRGSRSLLQAGRFSCSCREGRARRWGQLPAARRAESRMQDAGCRGLLSLGEGGGGGDTGAELLGPRCGREHCLDAAQHQDSESGRPLYSWPAAESAHGPRHGTQSPTLLCSPHSTAGGAVLGPPGLQPTMLNPHPAQGPTAQPSPALPMGHSRDPAFLPRLH